MKHERALGRLSVRRSYDHVTAEDSGFSGAELEDALRQLDFPPVRLCCARANVEP